VASPEGGRFVGFARRRSHDTSFPDAHLVEGLTRRSTRGPGTIAPTSAALHAHWVVGELQSPLQHLFVSGMDSPRTADPYRRLGFSGKVVRSDPFRRRRNEIGR